MTSQLKYVLGFLAFASFSGLFGLRANHSPEEMRHIQLRNETRYNGVKYWIQDSSGKIAKQGIMRRHEKIMLHIPEDAYMISVQRHDRRLLVAAQIFTRPLDLYRDNKDLLKLHLRRGASQNEVIILDWVYYDVL